jgi:hypothetical protein
MSGVKGLHNGFWGISSNIEREIVADQYKKHKTQRRGRHVAMMLALLMMGNKKYIRL